jgi:hypothetical protein
VGDRLFSVGGFSVADQDDLAGSLGALRATVDLGQATTLFLNKPGSLVSFILLKFHPP